MSRSFSALRARQGEFAAVSEITRISAWPEASERRLAAPPLVLRPAPR
jgi:hypothetical protein